MRKFFLVVLIFAVFFVPVTAWAAGQNIVISGPIAIDVYGNGTPPDGTPLAVWPDNADGNSVTVNNGGSVNMSITGGYADSNTGDVTATGNTVEINGGTVGADIYGGYASSNTGDAAATGNTVEINGGTVVVETYGGYAWSNAGNTAATDNTVSISGSPVLANTIIYGGSTAATGDPFTGNRLEIKTAVSVKEVRNFEFIDFYLPSGIADGGTMLALSLTTILTDVKVDLKFNTSAPNLAAGNVITLIDDVTGTFAAKTVTVSGYEFEISKSGGALIATVTGVPSESGGGGGCDMGLGLLAFAFVVPFVLKRR